MADLTGVWAGNDGSTYYIRQIEGELIWHATYAPLPSSEKANIAWGTIEGQTASLDWVDIPANLSGHGTVTLTVEDENQLLCVAQTGGFPTQTMTRLSVGKWEPMDTPEGVSFKHIAASCACMVWAQDTEDNLYIWNNGEEWQLVEPPEGVILVQVDVAMDRTVLAVDADGKVWMCAGLFYDEWELISESPLIKQVALGSSGAVWAIGADREAYQLVDGVWETANKQLDAISVGHDGTVYGVDTQVEFVEVAWKWSEEDAQWEYATNYLKQVSVGNAELVIGVAHDNTTYQFQPKTQTWQLVTEQTISQVSMGMDGWVFAVGLDGKLYTLSPNLIPVDRGLPEFGPFAVAFAIFVLASAIAGMIYVQKHSTEVVDPTQPLVPGPAQAGHLLDPKKFLNIFTFGYSKDQTEWFLPSKTSSGQIEQLLIQLGDQGYNAILAPYDQDLWTLCNQHQIKYLVSLFPLLDAVPQTTNPQIPQSVIDVVKEVEARRADDAYVGYEFYEEVEYKRHPSSGHQITKFQKVVDLLTKFVALPELSNEYVLYLGLRNPRSKLTQEAIPHLVNFFKQDTSPASILFGAYQFDVNNQQSVLDLATFAHKRQDIESNYSATKRPGLCQLTPYENYPNGMSNNSPQDELASYFQYVFYSRMAIGCQSALMLQGFELMDKAKFQANQGIEWKNSARAIKDAIANFAKLQNEFTDLGFFLLYTTLWKYRLFGSNLYEKHPFLGVNPRQATYFRVDDPTGDASDPSGGALIGWYKKKRLYKRKRDQVEDDVILTVNPYYYKDNEIKLTIDNTSVTSGSNPPVRKLYRFNTGSGTWVHETDVQPNDTWHSGNTALPRAEAILWKIESEPVNP